MCEVPGSRPLVAKSLEVIRVDDSESCVVSGDGSSKTEEYLLMNGKVDFSYKNKQQVVRILILKPNNEKKNENGYAKGTEFLPQILSF